MSVTASSKIKLLGYVLLGLGLWVLISAWHSASPGGTAPPDSAPADQPQGVTSSSSNGLESPLVRGEASPLPSDRERPTIDAVPPGEETGTQPASGLQEAELEHLSEVFLNTLHPLFQYDFPLDQEARAAIDAFVASMPEDLTSEDLETISAMIETGLSSAESEDLAFIITHLYRLEQEEARIMSEGAPVTTMAQQLEAQERLAQLRDQWFGPELSELLFSGADDAGASSDQISAGSQPAYDDMEEPPEALAEAQAELADMESAWEQRYQVFLAEKEVIDRAGLDQTEKDRQIEALLQQHYIPRELKAARAFDQVAE